MATRKISTRLAIEGESAYKQAIRDCNNEIKTMRSELTLVQSKYQTSANSMEALKAKGEALGRAFEAQKQKVETLKADRGTAPRGRCANAVPSAGGA